jgi:hypothetical protein
MKHFILFLTFFYYGFLSFAQQIFDGEYLYNGIKGQARYEYKVSSEGTPIKNGNFRFLQKSLDALGANELSKIEILGKYSNDQKTGTWDYLKEFHQVDWKDVENFVVKYQLKSQQIQLKSEYQSGLPHGNWNFKILEYASGKINPIAQAEQISFNKGVIEGEFQYKEFQNNKTYFINGKLSKGGFFDGEWTLVYEDQEKRLISEIRKYDKGFLLGLVKRNLENGALIQETVNFKTIDKLKEVQNRKNSRFRIADEKFDPIFNDGFLSGFEEFEVQVDGNHFISEFLSQVLRFDPLFVNNEGELIQFPMFTKRFVYEVPKDQQQYLILVPEIFVNSKKIVNDFLNNQSLTIHHKNYKSLSETFAFFQFYNNKLNHIQELILLFENQNIQYVDLNYFKERELSGFQTKDIIQYSFAGDIHQIDFEYPAIHGKHHIFQELYAYLQSMQEQILYYQKIAEEELKIIEQNEQLNQLQVQIVNEKERLNALFLENQSGLESERRMLAAVHSRIVEGTFKSMEKEFTEEKNPVLKLTIAENTLNTLKEAEVQYQFLRKIYPIQKELDSLYTEEVFNPFTYTRYSQRVKERLYIAGVEILYEYYVKGLMSEKDVFNFNFWKEKLDKLTQKMLLLRDQDTRRIERRLNKRESVSRIETILGL